MDKCIIDINNIIKNFDDDFPSNNSKLYNEFYCTKYYDNYKDFKKSINNTLYNLRGYTLFIKNLNNFNNDSRCTSEDIRNDYIPKYYSKNNKIIKLNTKYNYIGNILSKSDKLLMKKIHDEGRIFYKNKFNPYYKLTITKDTKTKDLRKAVWNIKSSKYDTWYELLTSYDNILKIDPVTKYIFLNLKFSHGS
jgi:hypothetical protein